MKRKEHSADENMFLHGKGDNSPMYSYNRYVKEDNPWISLGLAWGGVGCYGK